VTALHSYIAKEDRSEVAALYRVERFWSLVETSADPSACWPWRGQIDDNGYATFPDGKTTALAHRVAYILAYNEDPGDLTLDHLCHTLDTNCPGGVECMHRRCVRPSHQEPVERGENTRRAIRLITEAVRRREDRRQTCKHGHPWIPENISIRKNGARRCKICHRDDVRRAKEKMQARQAEAVKQESLLIHSWDSAA